MIRALARFFGLLLVAAGFVGVVVDGTRSIANGELAYLPLGDLAMRLFPKGFAAIEPAVTRIHPALWDPVLADAFLVPASLLGLGLGLLLIWLGRRPPEPIGFLAGP
ncbi:MAG TPA: PetM family of cytochrome b6f complex subunit 7 [Beijerinckiaceae bacterium]|jgi:hypothetical protein